MAGGTAEDRPVEFGRVSRIRGLLFENLTRAASAVGVFALVVLLAYTALAAFQPFTADPRWYVVLGATLGIPSLAVGGYCWRNPAATKVAFRALGAALAGLALASVLVLWLGGQLAFVVLATAVVPTAAVVALLRRRRRALRVAIQLAGIVVAGLGLASLGAVFAGTQATLVYAVGVGVPAALLGRFFLARPAVGSVGTRAIGAALLGAVLAAVAVEAARLTGTDPGDAAVGVYALGAVLGVALYAVPLFRGRDADGVGPRATGTTGLFGPFVLLAGALGAYLFHREFVVLAPTTPLLYGLVAGLPAVVFAWRVARSSAQGRLGLVVPLIATLGLAVGLAFHDRYVILAPTALPAFGLALSLAFGAYAWHVIDGDVPGRLGLLAPVAVGGGLLSGLLGARYLGYAGPDTWLDVAFLTGGSHYRPELTGIHPALVGSLYLMFVVVLVAFPVGVGAAIYLEEYASASRWRRFLEINIANLAGVPSVVYGLLGVAVFVRYGGLELGAVLAGGLALSLLILPIVIVSAQEAIRAVPDSLRQASYGMGATRWQTIRSVVLPRALPGILTGTILALGRAVGETAPLIMVGLAAIGGVPNSLTAQGTAMPLQVFAWALDARQLFREHVAAAGAMTLLVVLLGMNAVAIIIRNKYQRDR